MKILISSESNNDKYFRIIDDIISREQSANPNTHGFILNICPGLKSLGNLDSESTLGKLFNQTYQDYANFVSNHFDNMKFNFRTLQLGQECVCTECIQVVADVINESATTTFATLYQRSRDFREYPKYKQSRLEKLISQLYFEYKKLLITENFDVIYIPSGKNSWAKILIKVVESFSPHTIVYFYDAFGSENHYFCERYMPTDLEGLQSALSNMSQLDASQEAISHAWFMAQSSSKAQNFYLGTRNLEVERNGAKERISIFTSSEDEFIGLSKWSDSSFSSQYSGLYEAARDLLDKMSPAIQLVVRFHPHLRYKSVFDNFRIAKTALAFKRLGCEVLLPNKTVSAKSIIDESSKVVVWNSTVGIEAAYQGVQAYNLANAIYGRLGATTQVVELADLWKEVDNGSKKEGAIKYGFFMATTSYRIDSWVFYNKNRYSSYLHYLLFANHHGFRSKARLWSNRIFLKSLSLVLTIWPTKNGR